MLSWIPEGFDPTLAEAPVDAARYEAVFESWSTDYGFGFDFTPYFELNVSVPARVGAAGGFITYLLSSSTGRSSASSSPHINARQKSILVALCREQGLFCASRRISAASASPTAPPGPIFWGWSARGIWCGSRKDVPSRSAPHPDLQEKIVQLGGRCGRLGGGEPGGERPL